MRADPTPKQYAAEEKKQSALQLDLPEEITYENVVKNMEAKHIKIITLERCVRPRT